MSIQREALEALTAAAKLANELSMLEEGIGLIDVSVIARADVALSAPAEHHPAEQVCAEAYQAVGVMLSDLGIFDTERSVKLLDNLSQARMVHADVLPWESVSAPTERVVPAVATQAGIEMAASWVEKRAHSYDKEHGVTDPETGTREYPGNGDEYIGELLEIAEGIRGLSATPSPTEPAEEPAEQCLTCNGHGQIGGLRAGEGGYDAEPCPDCNTPAQEPAGVDALVRSVCASDPMTADGDYCLDKFEVAALIEAARATPTAPVAPTADDMRADFEWWYTTRGHSAFAPLGSQVSAVAWASWLASGGYTAPDGWVVAPKPWGLEGAAPPPAEAREPLSDAEMDNLALELVKGGKSVNWLCRRIEHALAAKWGIPLAGNTEGQG